MSRDPKRDRIRALGRTLRDPHAPLARKDEARAALLEFLRACRRDGFPHHRIQLEAARAILSQPPDQRYTDELAGLGILAGRPGTP